MVVAAVEQVFPESPALLPARTNNLLVSALTGFMGALPELSGRGILDWNTVVKYATAGNLTRY